MPTNDDDDNDHGARPSPLSHELLSAVVHAACIGSATISSLSDRARGATVQYKADGDSRSALTLADTSAQRVVVSSLLGAYPGLNVVGEEDGTVEADGAHARGLRRDLLVRCEWAGAEEGGQDPPPQELDWDELVVYVDPLDGTREFVEGRLDAVQCLIGVVYKGLPIMGAVGLPFPKSEDSETEALFGMVGKGIGKVRVAKNAGRQDGEQEIEMHPLPEIKRYREGDSVCVSSGDSAGVRPAVDLAERIFEGGISRQLAGATGNKLVRVVYGQTTLSLLHDKTCLWDTAAPTALLAAVGGKVTDYFGDPLVYNNKELGNRLGVVASAPGARRVHDRMAEAMRGDQAALSFLERFGLSREDGAAQCVDITRDLDGYPLTAGYFARHMGVDEEGAFYSCPEEGAVRGLMSNGCRVSLRPSGKTAFYKRIVFEHLDHARAKMRNAPHKLVRDANSYRVEASFLASGACRSVIEEAGLRIPRCYDAGLAPCEAEPIKSKFSLLLEDFSPSDGWSQRWLIESDDECRAALSALAKMHAFFWNGSSFWDDEDAARELEEGVWESAGYVQPKLQTVDQCKKVASGWATSRLRCREELEPMPYWDDLGERLESAAEGAGRRAHPFAVPELRGEYRRFQTFTHGDPKQANFFFRAISSSSGGGEPEVGLIDFQWSGFGLAATDVAHFLSAAVHARLLGDGGEARLLRHYHGELLKYLISFGAFDGPAEAEGCFGLDVLVGQYETAVLDMCRLVIAYAWSRFEPVGDDDGPGRARTMNKNSYNKSMPNVVWLMSRCDGILRSRGI